MYLIEEIYSSKEREAGILYIRYSAYYTELVSFSIKVSTVKGSVFFLTPCLALAHSNHQLIVQVETDSLKEMLHVYGENCSSLQSIISSEHYFLEM